MRVSKNVVELNSIAKEILLAISYLTLIGAKKTSYAIAKRINEVREQQGNFMTIKDSTVSEYLKTNLKIKEIN